MIKLDNEFDFVPGEAVKAFEMEDSFVWDGSVIYAKGKYHLFCSRMKKKYGFAWLYHSEIIHAVSDKSEGPYKFQKVVLPMRGREFFDGMNTHNPCIREYDGKYYLYYMGTTYNGTIPARKENAVLAGQYALETWNRKRIGLAVAEDIDGEFKRCDEPIILPRDCSKWDCTCTTNPSVAIMPNGKTYMIYKSRCAVGAPLQLGVAVADKPDGKFERLSDNPILQFEDSNMHIEDPFLWYDGEKEKFCIIAKDDSKNGSFGITGECGAGFYAESRDCINFEIGKDPKVYSKKIKWENGTEAVLDKFERPSLLFNENGIPTHLFCAAGFCDESYVFKDGTFIVCQKMKAKE